MASSHAFVEAARLGIGWGMNPLPLIRAEIAAGSLVPLAEETLDVALHWQVTRLAGRALAPLTASLRRAAAAALA